MSLWPDIKVLLIPKYNSKDPELPEFAKCKLCLEYACRISQIRMDIELYFFRGN